MAMVAQVTRGLRYTMQARPRLAALGQKKHSPTVPKLKMVYPATSFGDALGKAPRVFHQRCAEMHMNDTP